MSSESRTGKHRPAQQQWIQSETFHDFLLAERRQVSSVRDSFACQAGYGSRGDA